MIVRSKFLRNKGVKVDKKQQLMLFGLLWVSLLSVAYVSLRSFQGDFDTRDKASQLCIVGCADEECVPQCNSRECGTDGCGGSCGTCSGGKTCNEAGTCQTPHPIRPIEVNPDALYQCGVDADCRVVSEGCCPCSMGGGEQAVNKYEWMKQEKDALKCRDDIMCLAVYRCTNRVAKCVSNKCNLVEGPPTVEETFPPPVAHYQKGDLNQDGKVNLADYSIFLNDYLGWRAGGNLTPRSDLNKDQQISIADYVIFVQAYLDFRNESSEEGIE